MSAGTLFTEQLALRPVRGSDTDAIWRIHSDPRTNRFNPAGPMQSRADAVELVTQWAADWTDGQGYWAISTRDTPQTVIGFGGIRALEWHARAVYNLYYRLDPSAWGKGYATEIVKAAITRWHDLGEHLPLVARTTSDNVASQRTATKGGLKRRPDLDGEHDGVAEVVFALGW